MSRIADTIIGIQAMLEEGFEPATVAKIENVPLQWVLQIAEKIDAPDESRVQYDEDYSGAGAW